MNEKWRNPVPLFIIFVKSWIGNIILPNEQILWNLGTEVRIYLFVSPYDRKGSRYLVWGNDYFVLSYLHFLCSCFKRFFILFFYFVHDPFPILMVFFNQIYFTRRWDSKKFCLSGSILRRGVIAMKNSLHSPYFENYSLIFGYSLVANQEHFFSWLS